MQLSCFITQLEKMYHIQREWLVKSLSLLRLFFIVVFICYEKVFVIELDAYIDG